MKLFLQKNAVLISAMISALVLVLQQAISNAFDRSESDWICRIHWRAECILK
jgi:hypothetical protein